MAIKLAWEDDALWLQFCGEWAWAEYDQAVDDACTLLGEEARAICLVFNLLDGPIMPLEAVFTYLRRSARVLKVEQLIVIGANASVKGLLYVFARTNAALGWTPVFVYSPEEASSFLASWRQRGGLA